MATKILYHGSVRIIEKPIYRAGSKYNDYGYGFYCTEQQEIAKEWAAANEAGGYINAYEVNPEQMKILDLADPQYSVLDWLTLLICNRTFKTSSTLAVTAKEYLKNNFLIDISRYDCIAGYRADDSYFSFAKAFLNNEISIEVLARAMKLGKLGEQFVLVSKNAFEKTEYKYSEKVNGEVYYAKRRARDIKAKKEYAKVTQNTVYVTSGLFMVDILREEMKANDARIR